MNLYLSDINQTRFIEIRNDFDTNTKYLVYFEGDYNLFYLEGKSTVNYNSVDTAYEINIEPNSKVYLEIQNSSSYKNGILYVTAIDIDSSVTQKHTLYSYPYKNPYKKSIGSYRNFEKSFSDYKKNENSTFGLLATNPRITGNLKINVGSDGNIFLSVFEGIQGLSDEKYQRYAIKDNSNYVYDVYDFIGKNNISNTDLFNNISTPINIDTRIDLKYQQYNNVYSYGVSVFPSKNYTEKYKFLAPLYLKKEIPNYFIIFRKQGFQETNKLDFFKDLEILKTYDLTENSKLGKYLRELQKMTNWEKPPLFAEVNKSTFLNFSGIDINKGAITTKYIDFNSDVTSEKAVFELENNIVSQYSKNSIVSHNILNLDFLFDMEDRFDFSSIFGFYTDTLELQKLNLDTDAIKTLDPKILSSLYTDTPYVSQYEPYNYYTNTSIDVNNNKVNDGKHLFYTKDNNNVFYNVKSVGKKYDKFGYIGLDKSIDYRDFVCKDKTLYKKATDFNENGSPAFSYYDFKDSQSNFEQGDFFQISFEFGNTLQTMMFEADSESMFDGGMIRTSSEKMMGTTMTFPVSVYSNYIKTDTYIDNVYPGSVVYLNGTKQIVTKVVKNSETKETSLWFDESVSLTDITNMKFVCYDGFKNYFKIGKTITETLYSLEQTINSDTKLPIYSYLKDYRIYFVSKKSGRRGNKYNVLLNKKQLTNVINVYDILGSQDYHSTMFVGGSDYTTVTINKEDKELLSNSHTVVTSEGIFKILPFDNGGLLAVPSISRISADDTYYTIQYQNDRPTNTNNKLTELKVVCPIEFGVFSFYELRTFDTDYVSSEWKSKAILEEYKKYYGNYTDSSILLNDTFYTVINDSSKEYRFFLYFNPLNPLIDDSSVVVSSFSVGANSTYNISTMLSEYGQTSGYFYVQSEDRGFVNFKVVPTAWLEDLEVQQFSQYNLLENFNTEQVNNVRLDLLSKHNYSSKTLTTLDTEYDRLREKDMFQLSMTLEDVPKWQSMDGRDSFWNPYRLNFNRSFGSHNLSVYPSDNNIPSNLSYNWFFIDKVPFDISVIEETSKLYGFGRLNPINLLDTSYDYFEEYFTTGYPQVTNRNEYLTLKTRELYSIVNKVADGQYETMFKGMKYRFVSNVLDMTDYKFSILCTFDSVPYNSTNSLNIVTDKHCYSEEYVPSGCNTIGSFDLLRYAIDNLDFSDQTVTITYSFLNEGTVIEYNGNVAASSFNDLVIGYSTFSQEVANGFSEWKTLLESTYSTTNGCKNNLTVEFVNLGFEIGTNIPLDSNGIDYVTAQEYNIGNIRLGYTPLGSTEVAHTTILETVTNAPASILYSSSVVFTTEASINDGYSIKLTSAHELGHILGLGHTTGEGSVMVKTINQRQSYDYLYPNGLSTDVDGVCIRDIYGFPRVASDPLPPVDLVEDGDYLIEEQDDYKIYVNKKYKTICIYITNYLSVYNSKDRSLSYTDIYTTQKPKVWEEDVLVGSDVRLRTGINFSHEGTYLQNETFIVDGYNKQYSMDKELGNNPENSYYRLRSESTSNVQISYGHTSTYGENSLLFQKSYNEEGELDKVIFTEVKDGSLATEYNVPFGRPKNFETSRFYRVRGGKDIDNFNYRLTINHFITNLDNILFKVVDSNGVVTTDKLFSMYPIYPNVIEQGVEKVITDINRENGFSKINTGNSSNLIGLLRYSGSYEPSTKSVIFFAMKDELGLDYEIDFYKNNTRMLVENNSFGIITNKPVQKVSTQKILDDIVLNSKFVYPLENQTPVYYKDINVFKGLTDETYYDLFYNLTQKNEVSGLNDIKLKKGILNCTITSVVQTINAMVSQGTVTTTGNRVSVNIDLKKCFIDTVLPLINAELNQVYDTQSSSRLLVTKEEMVTNLISNDIYGYYKVSEILIYQKNYSGGTQDVLTVTIDDTFNLTQGVNKTDTDKLDIIDVSWDKKTNSNVSFGIKLKFDFI